MTRRLALAALAALALAWLARRHREPMPTVDVWREPFDVDAEIRAALWAEPVYAVSLCRAAGPVGTCNLLVGHMGEHSNRRRAWTDPDDGVQGDSGLVERLR